MSYDDSLFRLTTRKINELHDLSCKRDLKHIQMVRIIRKLWKYKQENSYQKVFELGCSQGWQDAMEIQNGR
jgi:hypothetical protein